MIADNEPVLVGWATVTQRIEDPLVAAEPLELMIRAARNAVARAGAPALGAAVDRIYTPRGRWDYANPGEPIGRAIGAARTTNILTTVGVLQQSLFGDACRRIRDGESQIALVVGGDCGYRLQRAAAGKVDLPKSDQSTEPDIVMAPSEELRHPAELRVGLKMPVGLYAMVHSAVHAAAGRDHATLARHAAELFNRLSEGVVGNPDAWVREPVPIEEIMTPGPRNKMQAFPYTRMHCSNWSVDQAGALIFCSAGKARELGIPDTHWIYPRASAESNHMVQVSRRAELGRCPGARIAGERALDDAGLTVDQIGLIDLYSCFPVAVELFAAELGLSTDRPLTVTGGMPFGGGPYNNYVLQSTCRMADLLDRDRPAPGAPARHGLVSSVSGIVTKQGFGVWSTEPGEGFAFADVTDEVARTMPTREVAMDHEGEAKVAGCTVVHERGLPPRAIVIADAPDGRRVVAQSHEPQAMAAAERGLVGAGVRVADGHLFEVA